MLVPPGERSWAHLGTATGALASGPVFVWRRIVPQSCTLSVSPEIVAAREDFFYHGWTRINTDEDGVSLIRVHPCSSVVGSFWLRLGRAALYRGLPTRWPVCRPTALRLSIGQTARLQTLP